MKSTTHALTDEVQERICQFIRAGGFPHVACEAAGIPIEIYESWLQRAKKKGAGKHRAFATAVRQALALARLAAEAKILKEDALQWLKSGPGRESQDLAGWTAPTKPLIQENNAPNALLTSELQEIVATILRVLGPFPEARVAVARALEEAGEEGSRKAIRREIATSVIMPPIPSE